MENIRYLEGGGEMGAIMRNYNWSASSVGTPDQWPQSLRTTLGIILHSTFPMFLFWGEELTCFYNDAYRASMGNEGRHPAVGKPGKEVWPEVWDFIAPLIEQVMTTGKPAWFEDQPLPIYRNGRMEDGFWTFSYSPAYGDEGYINGVFVTCTETTAAVRNLQQVEQSEKNVRNMILQAPVAMCILRGPAYIIEVANGLMIELWGKKETDVMYKPVFEALPDAKEQGLEQLMDSVYNTGESFRANERPVVLLRNGKLETVYQDFVYDPYRDVDGTILGVLAISIDVTAQVLARQKIEEVVSERTRELAAANNSLQHSNAELAQFAYIASHDLQEPVRKISTFLQMLEQSLGPLDEKPKGYLAKINNATARMLTLIRDILGYSQLSKEIKSFTAVNLQQIVQDATIDFELLIEQKQAEIQYKDLPTIAAIPLQMAQLFGNLISNALKFSSTEVKPVISITATLLPGDQYKIEVSDNGIGFDQQYADQIFNIFQRLHRKTEFAGTGIGLATCKKIVQNHHGDIHATSVKGRGTVFTIILPAQQEALRT